MEKSIDNIIKFIETALGKDYCSVSTSAFNQKIAVGKKLKNKEVNSEWTKYIDFFINDNGDKLCISDGFYSAFVGQIEVSLTEVDKAKWTIIYNKVKDYETKSLEQFFDTFFKEEDNKPKDINDLDNEDE